MEIRLGPTPITITMRTPGDDFDLAMGFLSPKVSSTRKEDVSALRYCAGATAEGANTFNVVQVDLGVGVEIPDLALERNFYTTSSCGLCGKASLDAVRTQARWSVADDPLRLHVGALSDFPSRLREAQAAFEKTGGLHAAGIFKGGELAVVREDVGRHNAVDKVVGHALRNDWLPLRESVLMVSGRASFELVQKALMAGIPMLAAVSAPSSLAVDLAKDNGMTLVGFLRGASMNVYARPDRVDLHGPGDG